jgi:hypothetical protein
MIPIDIFINQLIQLGLADSFLEVIEKHYLKVTKIYSIISGVNEDNIKEMKLLQDELNDSITIIIELFEPVEDLIASNDSELSVSINNTNNIVEITVTNNFESEEDIYESRFNGRRTPYTPKWS